MICKNGYINEEKDPLPSKQEEDGGQHVQVVLGQHQGVEAGTLVMWSLEYFCSLVSSSKVNN